MAKTPQIKKSMWIIVIIIGALAIINLIGTQDNDAKSDVASQKKLDCKESRGGSCLKIIESSYVHIPSETYDRYRIVGQVQNIGTGKNDYNPWHGIKGACYYQGKLVDEAGSTFDLLEPGEITTFSVEVESHGQPVDECKVRVTY
jgi:hypothetical protein